MRKFLRMDEEYDEELERPWNTPAPEVVPIGVPGAYLPSEISGHKTVMHGDLNKVGVEPTFISLIYSLVPRAAAG
jgi:hypothetical protein